MIGVRKLLPLVHYLQYFSYLLHNQVAAVLVKVKCKDEKEKFHHSLLGPWAEAVGGRG